RAERDRSEKKECRRQATAQVALQRRHHRLVMVGPDRGAAPRNPTGSQRAWSTTASARGSVHSNVVRLGIIGFPGSGKTTLFNLLTGAEAGVAQAPGRGRLNVGVARVPDDRVTRLSALFQPRKTVYASVEVVDLAGFDRGERATLDVGELRQADALLH